MKISLRSSVGRGGTNRRTDVTLVQCLLNARLLDIVPLAPLVEDGRVGPATIGAIEAFQSRAAGLRFPDGRVDPAGSTLRALRARIAGEVENAPLGPFGPKNKPEPPTPESAACVVDQWLGDSSKWSQEKKLASMTPLLRPKVTTLIERLTKSGFRPKIFFGWRSVAVQAELVRKGNSRVSFSFHNAQQVSGQPNAYAADIIDSRYAWSAKAKSSGYWDAQGEEAKKLDLTWGGDWKNPWDPAHVQLLANKELGRIKRESGIK